jgi:hypothetical protein
MALLVVQHPVRDYQAWRAVYDSAGDMQRAAGVTAESVHQLAGDPNTVLVLHYFATVAEAESMISNPELKVAMERAGVVGPPRFEIYA